MHKEIFEVSPFAAYATDHLILVNADFPRNKKNKLSREQELMNDKLAEKYNPDGKFPFTVLLTPGGNVVKTWEGLPDEDASGFTSAVKKLCDEQ